MYDKMGDLTYI